MANVFAIHSVGNSIATYLRNSYPRELAGLDMPDCAFDLVSSGELAGEPDDATRITLYLYRITVNEHSRQMHGAAGVTRPTPLGLDLHFLMSAWAGNARDEHTMLAWAMRQLHMFPILDASSLSPEAGWGSNEVIQIIPAELSTEDVMRIWDALDPAYRLSVSYIARLVRLDPDAPPQGGRPVVATRFAYGEEVRT
jgi:Pvc16 N-terminal domain